MQDSHLLLNRETSRTDYTCGFLSRELLDGELIADVDRLVLEGDTLNTLEKEVPSCLEAIIYGYAMRD
jgi:hypothetical protein